MTKEQLANYIASEVQNLSGVEREDLKKDLMKLKDKSIRWLAEHIEDHSEVGV